MSKPKLEIAHVIEQFGHELVAKHKPNTWTLRTLNTLRICRTAALGGHKELCDCCGKTRISYNSCRNRHCPKCHASKQAFWIEDVSNRIIDTKYFHLVFTLPHELNSIILCNMDALLALLFSSVNEVIKAFAADPQWRLEGNPGFIAVLHTWTQTLMDHFHLHCLVPGGALSSDKLTWNSSKSNFLFRTNPLMLAFKNI